MKAVYLREQYGYTFDEIMKCLSLDSKEKCTDILTRLKRFNIIKKVKITSLKNKTDLSDIDDDLAENVEIDPNQNGILYKIKFVGVVIL
ncbi:TPA: hypothetical protein U1334_001419, partial [Streptococcus suis]|nr:hypothetical protein [Streptococcus suis]HEM5235973.1 hypothetical protein [Streptococcus suis]